MDRTTEIEDEELTSRCINNYIWNINRRKLLHSLCKGTKHQPNVQLPNVKTKWETISE